MNAPALTDSLTDSLELLAALQGLLAADFDYSTSALAERAVRYADALIAELDKPVKP